MKSNDLKNRLHSLQRDIYSEMYNLYKAASLGTQRFVLDEAVTYSDGFDYHIKAIEWDYSPDLGDVWTFYQTEEDDDEEEGIGGVQSVETLLEILEAMEQTLLKHS